MVMRITHGNLNQALPPRNLHSGHIGTGLEAGNQFLQNPKGNQADPRKIRLNKKAQNRLHRKRRGKIEACIFRHLHLLRL